MSHFSPSEKREILSLFCNCCNTNIISGLAADLASNNLVYDENVLIIETDGFKAKLGDGVTPYVDLDYVLGV